MFTVDGIDYVEIGVLSECKVIGGKPDRGVIVIPAKANGYRVTQIADGSFSGMTTLTDLQIPDSLDIVGTSAFSNCQNLKRVIFYKTPNTSKKIEINQSAFSECFQLEYFSSAAPLFLYDYVFKRCKRLRNLNAVVSACLSGTFDFCEQLESIAFDDYAQWTKTSFNNCKKLKTLILNGRIGKATLRTESSMEAVRDKHLVCKSDFPHLELAYEGYSIKPT